MTEKKQTSRRDFFQNVSAGAAGMAFASVLSTLHAAAAAQQPDYYGKMDVSKLGNVLREPNVVEFKPWKSIHSTITSPMITAWGTGDIPESKLAIGFAYITKPDSLGGATHSHAHDQWIFLIGGDGKFPRIRRRRRNAAGRQGQEGQLFLLFLYSAQHAPLPAGHQRVGKPIVFIDARIG